MTNKAQITSWVNDYGEDSDFVRGVFPRGGNHRTAKALGLAVPPSLLVLADEVIE